MRLRTALCFGALVVTTLASHGASSEPAATDRTDTTPARRANREVRTDDGARVPELETAVRALVKSKGLENAQIGVVVMDCETGAILAQHGEHEVLNPASNAKLYTAAAALAILHGSHKYQTTLNGTIKSGVASGLVLRGLGDPSLETSDLAAMVRQLKSSGVKRVEGDLSVEQSFFDDMTTPPAFEQQPNEWASFRAPVSAVAVDGNTITMNVRPQGPGAPARVWFDPPGFVDVDGEVSSVEGRADKVVLTLAGAGARMTAKVGGSIGSDARIVRYTRRAEDPQLLAGYVLKSLLADAGIELAGEVKLLAGGKAPRGSVLAKRESAPLSTLLYALGKQSDNFYAEMVFKSIAAEAKARPGKSGDAAEIVTAWLDKHGLGDAGVIVKNGSGLFDANRTTASSVSRLLRYAWQDPRIRHEFVAQLAIGGVDGTLHGRVRGTAAERSVRAKTGTLHSAIALSGYVLAPEGKHTLAFAILFNKVAGHIGEARVASDQLVMRLHQRLWR